MYTDLTLTFVSGREVISDDSLVSPTPPKTHT